MNSLATWSFSTNWPAVYIFYNDAQAYVGETLDAVRRTEQHRMEREFDVFTDVCMISDKTFNKSVILDLESFLIKYMSAVKTLLNSNAGIVDHNYFYKDAYRDDFREIWTALIKKGVVSQTIFEIENSELFKYSPYKTLSEEQQRQGYEIINLIAENNNAGANSVIEVTGGAGTGKTILAVYLVKLLTDVADGKVNWDAVDEYGDMVKKLLGKLSGIRKIGFVVPMKELRTSMKKVFSTIDGLSSDMVIGPDEAVDSYYDLLVVDEAHRLYYRKHLPGGRIYARLDDINRKLMGVNFSTDSDVALTELDWIIRSSRLQVLFYDDLQRIRTADIPQDRFDSICGPRLCAKLELFSQMRCKGGNGYYDYVKKVLETTDLDPREYVKISGYELTVVDSAAELFDMIGTREKEGGLCRVVTGPGWAIEQPIIIDDLKLQWEKDVTSIHKIQGFDLNYAGVIFGKEVYYDKSDKRICVDKGELMDNFTKSSGDESMRRFILNIYLTLMTRGINGTYVYAVDEDLRAYLKYFLQQ